MATVRANEISWGSGGYYTIKDSNGNALMSDIDTGIIPTGNSSIDSIYTLNVVFS